MESSTSKVEEPPVSELRTGLFYKGKISIAKDEPWAILIQ